MSDTQHHDEKAAREFLPPLDFSSIVFPFYTQALVKLGLMEDPLKKTAEENLEFAKRLIDILDLLKDRTKGNLNGEEEKFLESCLLQLKMNYMKQADIIKM
jgi:ABC-type hemin transport system ATPase subunit